MKQFNVLTWNFNNDKLEYYDVIPYLVDCYKERVKRCKENKTNIDEYASQNSDKWADDQDWSDEFKSFIEKAYGDANLYYKAHFGVPETFDEFRGFIESESACMFWSRCEWEMIIHGWPVRKNDYKIDVHEQIMMNIDVITEILMDEVKEYDR
jgi:hypothetical protein